MCSLNYVRLDGSVFFLKYVFNNYSYQNKAIYLNASVLSKIRVYLKKCLLIAFWSEEEAALLRLSNTSL